MQEATRPVVANPTHPPRAFLLTFYNDLTYDGMVCFGWSLMCTAYRIPLCDPSDLDSNGGDCFQFPPVILWEAITKITNP